jgi:hypothetical protein
MHFPQRVGMQIAQLGSLQFQEMITEGSNSSNNHIDLTNSLSIIMIIQQGKYSKIKHSLVLDAKLARIYRHGQRGIEIV